MISGIAVRNYLTVLGERGLSPQAILGKSGVAFDRLSDAQYMLEAAQHRAIVENILILTGDEGIGLELGARTDVTRLGAFGHAALTSKTVRDTHRLWERFGAVLVGIGSRLDIVTESPTSVQLVMVRPDPLDPLFNFSVEEMLGLVYMIGEPLVGQTPTMLNLNLSYPAPTHAHKYRALFDCPIRFSASKTTLEVSREWFDGPIRTYDGEFNSICLKHCESMFLRIDGAKPISAALRNVFAQFTDRPLPSLEQSAKALRLAPRTLRRRLHDEGTNFRRQIDDYRSEQAKKLFSYGTVSPKEAAYLLGFKEHSAFRHAFKGWTGQTISEYRAKMAASR